MSDKPLPLAKDATPDDAVQGDWLVHPESGRRWHQAVVQDEWRTTCQCCGCPECCPGLVPLAKAEGLEWVPAERWGDAVCQDCDTLTCEQPRLGLWRSDTLGICGACLRLRLKVQQ